MSTARSFQVSSDSLQATGCGRSRRYSHGYSRGTLRLDCVRVCLHVCVREGASSGVCVCVASCCVLRVHAWGPPACAGLRAYLCGCVCARFRVRTRGCATQACTRGTLWLLRWYLRDINGTRRVLGGALDGALKIQSRGTQGVLVLMGCTLGYLGGYSREVPTRVCDCASSGLCGTSQERRMALQRGALGELAPPKGYSTSTHVGFLSCGPSPRVRLRRHAPLPRVTAAPSTPSTRSSARPRHSAGCKTTPSSSKDLPE